MMSLGRSNVRQLQEKWERGLGGPDVRGKVTVGIPSLCVQTQLGAHPVTCTEHCTPLAQHLADHIITACFPVCVYLTSTHTISGTALSYTCIPTSLHNFWY